MKKLKSKKSIPTIKPVKQPHEVLIQSFQCLYVHSFASPGILKLHPHHLIFTYATGKDAESTFTKYSDIEDVKVSDHCGHAMNNLEIKTIQNNSLFFSGITNSNKAKDLILLIKKQLEEPKDYYGLIPLIDDSKTVHFHPLENPIQILSIIIPASLSTVATYVKGKEIATQIYNEFGNEDIVMSDWVQCDGYKERRTDFNKIVVLPVLGKNAIKIAEFQQLFEMDGKICIHGYSDLGKTPYSDCFDPYVQLIFTDKGGTTEFTVYYEMVWSSVPFVKSIIDNKCTTEVTATYKALAKAYCKAVGGEENDKKVEEEPEESQEDKFKIFKIIYMVIIWLLLIGVIIVAIMRFKNSRQKNIQFKTKEMLGISSLIFTLLLLIYF